MSIIFGIDLHFLRNIKYHQEVWKNLSVEILWKCLPAGYLVHLRPCPAAGHLDTASAVVDNFQGLCFFLKKSATWIKGPLPGLPCVTCLAQFEDNLKLHSVVCCFLSIIEKILFLTISAVWRKKNTGLTFVPEFGRWSLKDIHAKIFWFTIERWWVGDVRNVKNNWGVTNFVLEITCPEECLNLRKLGFISEEGHSGCKSQYIAIRALKGNVLHQIWFKWTY